MIMEQNNSWGPKSPKSLHELFWAMTWLALQGFGGVFPVARRVLIDERQWFTAEIFLEEWAVAQVLPGPNIVNLSVMFGARCFGWMGAFVAVAGIFSFPAILLICVAVFFEHLRDYPAVASALQGMGAVSAGLIAGTSLKMASSLRTHPLSFFIAIIFTLITFVLLAVVKFPLIPVMLVMGISSCMLTYFRIIQQHRKDILP
jgi:chromate transporter